jgi:metallophosphoesterase (TIGR00282 family)
MREERGIDFVVANGENSAGGAGITTKTFKELLNHGVDVVTTGNHVYRQRDVMNIFKSEEDRLIRPANFSERSAGPGFTVRDDAKGRRVGVVNLQTRVFMGPSEDPFTAADRITEELSGRTDLILFDVHGEATSEKKAMGYYLDGRVAAVVGTHTHVPTADECVLPGGTAYITDLGMNGPHDSCLGVEKEIIIRKFLTGMPARFTVATGDARMQGLLIDLDDGALKATGVERIDTCLPD